MEGFELISATTGIGIGWISTLPLGASDSPLLDQGEVAVFFKTGDSELVLLELVGVCEMEVSPLGNNETLGAGDSELGLLELVGVYEIEVSSVGDNETLGADANGRL